MQATLIYNPNSGGTDQIKPEEITEALSKVGYHPVYRATSSEEDLDRVLRGVRGLVVVAGGDGSVRAVVTRMIGRKTPVALLPLGTANNIARALRISGTPLEIISRMDAPVRRAMDVGMVRSPWGTDYFLEAAGYGMFAETLLEYDPEQGKSILRGISSVVKTLTSYDAPDCQILLDGKDISGRYLMFEVLNTDALGPRIKLAPDADPGDGLLDVVRIHQDQRDSLMRYITGILTEKLEELPSVEVARGRELVVRWSGFPLHVDAEVRPEDRVRPKDQSPAVGIHKALPRSRRPVVRIKVLPGAVQFWLPREDGGASENLPAPVATMTPVFG